jgi:hypothetical protein
VVCGENTRQSTETAPGQPLGATPSIRGAASGYRGTAFRHRGVTSPNEGRSPLSSSKKIRTRVILSSSSRQCYLVSLLCHNTHPTPQKKFPNHPIHKKPQTKTKKSSLLVLMPFSLHHFSLNYNSVWILGFLQKKHKKTRKIFKREQGQADSPPDLFARFVRFAATGDVFFPAEAQNRVLRVTGRRPKRTASRTTPSATPDSK